MAATAPAAFRQAEDAEKAGRHNEAARRYGEMAAAFPNNDLADDALLAQAKLLAGHLGEPREAMKCLHLLLTRYPETDHSPEALFITAVCVDRLVGSDERAITTYRRVVEAVPGTEFSRRAQARIRALQNR